MTKTFLETGGGFTADELHALKACVEHAADDLRNWRPQGTDEEASHATMCNAVDLASVVLARPSTAFVNVTGTLTGSMLEPTDDETEAWQYLVGNGDTKLGLLSWVAAQRGLDEIPCQAPPPPAAVGALDLGDVMSVIGWAGQFADDWNEDANQAMESPEEREQAAKAVETVERVKAQMLELFPLLARAIRDAGDAKGAIHSLLHQVDQMKGMFNDEDGTIEDAVECGEEVAHTLGCLRADLEALGTVPIQPVRIVVDLSGGCVQGASADGDVEFIYVDYDTDGGEEDRLVDIPQPDGKPERGTVSSIYVDHDPVWVSAVETLLRAKDTDNA